MEYAVVKWIHILSSTILFGAGVGSAFHLFAATLGRRSTGVHEAARNVVRADNLFTIPTAILQPASGLWLVYLMGTSFATPWIKWSMLLYAAAIGCWLPVVWIQFRLREHAAGAAARSAPLPPVYWRFFAWWVGLGAVAFLAFIGIFWLMVVKTVPFA